MSASDATARRLGTLAAVAAAALAASVALHPVLEPDLFWHLASGRWILQHRAIPRVDVFSYPTMGREWVNLQWLFDVLAARAWVWGGPDALVLGKAAALAGVAALLVAAGRAAGAGPAAACFAAGLAVLAGAERTTERPEIVTYVALATLSWVIERARRGGGRRALAAMPVLVAVWINLHSLAFLGAAALLLHAVLAASEARLPERWRSAPPSPHLARDLTLAGLASAIALLANPWGVRAWTFPLTLFRRIGTGPDVFGRILEFVSPLRDPGDPALRFFWVLVAVTVACSLARPTRPALARFGGVLPFLALALLARRNAPLFAIAAAAPLAASVSEIARSVAARLGEASERRLAIASAVGVPMIVLGVAIAVLRGASPGLLGLPRERGLGVEAGIFPEECLAALDRLGLEGRLFHDLDFGGYVAWRDPGRATFIDGRLEVAGPDRLARFIEAHESPAAWERLRAQWDVNILLLEHASRGSAAFLRGLLASGEWTPVCLSPEAVLLVSRARFQIPAAEERPAPGAWAAWLGESHGAAPAAGDALAPLARPLDRWLRVDPAPSAVRRAVRYANLCMTLGRIAPAREGYEAVLARAPADPEALFNLGLCAMHEGRAADAHRIWEDALPRVDAASRDLFRRALAQSKP
ncbi:MAG: hypothetical protein U0167_05640 [bacterium]